MEETIQALRSAPDTAVSSVPIIIGGAQIGEQIRQYVGADYWTNDAMKGVRLCQRLLSA